MDHLNRVAHASITVYHNFHDEVAFNHQHWWRCTVCQSHHAPHSLSVFFVFASLS